MAWRFNAAGIPARAITGGCSEDDQEQIFDDLGKGIVKVVTYCEMLSEGVDVPSINAAILLRPTASVTMYLQQVGRCLRPKADGSSAIILDHVGNVQRHGLPTEERNWTLEGRDKRKRDAAPSVRMCPRCFAANATTAQVCGECGHEFTTEARELEEAKGELVEITVELRRKRAEVGGARSMEDLLRLERQRGYKPGWAKHIMAARQTRRVG